MTRFDDCVKKAGKALSPKDVAAIRDLGGDIAAANKFLGQLKRQVPGRLAQEARKNEIGLYSLVEHVTINMDLQEWRVKKKRQIVYTDEMKARRLVIADILRDKVDAGEDSKDSPEWKELNELDIKRYEQKHIDEQADSPTAPGDVIWNRIKKAPGVKADELQFMGLEEYLLQGKQLNLQDATEEQLSDIEGTRKELKRFTRQEVVDFIQANGIRVVMEYGERQGTNIPAPALTWDDGAVDINSSNWEGDAQFYAQDPEAWFDFEKWVSENLDNDVFKPTPIEAGRYEDQEFTLGEPIQLEDGQWTAEPTWLDGVPIPTNARWDSREDAQSAIDANLSLPHRRRHQRWFDEVPGEADPEIQRLIDAKDWAGLVDHIGIQSLSTAADSEIIDEAYETAESEYKQNPYKRWSVTNDDVDAYIWGNDDVGYRVEIGGVGYVDDGTLYDLDEAKDFTQRYINDHGMTIADPNDIHNWGQKKYQPPVIYDNYRNQKLFLPSLPVSTPTMQDHFPGQPGMVAFNRMIDVDGSEELMLVETQSDWESDARKAGGYVTGADVAGLEDAREGVNSQLKERLAEVYDDPMWASETRKQFNELAMEIIDNYIADHETALTVLSSEQLPVYEQLTPELVAELKPLVEQLNAFDRQIKAEKSGILSMPYKGSKWTELSLKYAIQEAIDGGYERLSWSDESTLQGIWRHDPPYKYAPQYEQRMPTFVKKLTGQQARHVQLDGSPMPSTDYIEADTTNWKVVRNDGDAAVYVDVWVAEREPQFPIWVTNAPERVALSDNELIALAARQERQASSQLPPQGKFVIDITPELVEHFESKKTLMQDEDRGELILQPDGSRLMKLGQASDLSTFLHEAMHLFVETEKQLASTMGVTANNQALMDFVGAESFDDINATTPEGIARHEKLSRAFEAYLREGKAPSLKLRDAFAAFKYWLMSLYKNADELDVDLNDNIRNAFDRMLATEAEIVEQMTTPAYEEMYTQDDHPGMTDAEFEAYELAVQRRKDRASETVTDKLMKEYTARRTKEWKEERMPLVEEEYERLSKLPVYQLLITLANHTAIDIDGVEIESRMDYDLVLQAMPEWNGKVPGQLGFGRALTKQDGLDPKMYARQYGYDSVPEMINDIISVPTLKAASEAEAEKRMIALHGDILNEGRLEAEVTEALHNDTQAEVLLAELKALKPKRKQSINREFLKAEAKRIIGEMTYGQIQPNKYLRAEIRAAKRSGEAKPEMKAELYDAKVAQLMNHYLWREATDARAAMERYRRYIKGAQKRIYDPKNVDTSYATNYNALANVYDMSNDPEMQSLKLTKFLTWFNSQTNSKESDEDLNLIQMVTFDPNLAKAMAAHNDPRINFTLPKFEDLTVSELRGLYDQLRHLRYVGGNLAALKSAEILAERQEFAENIKDNGGEPIENKATRGSKESPWAPLRYLGNTMLSLTNLLRELDGHKDTGPRVANRMINFLIEDSNNKKLDLTMDMNKRFEEELKGIEKLGLSGMGFTTEYRRDHNLPVGNDFEIIGENGQKQTMNPEEIFMMAIYWGTESSREAIRQGRDMSDNDVMRMMSKLTVEQLEMVNSIWKLNETLWQELSRVSVAVYNVSPEKLDPTPFEVNGVVMTGGHMRLFYNTHAEDIQNEQDHHYSAMMVGKTGSLIERQGSGGKSVLLDRNNISRAMAESIHFMAFAENGKHIAAIMNGKNVKAAIIKYHGRPFQKALRDTLVSIINNKPEKNSTAPMISAMLRHLRKAAVYRYLIGSPRNILQQVSALPRAVHYVGRGKFLEAFTRVQFDDGSALAFILENSAFMRNRTSLVNRESHETLTKMSVHNKRTSLWAAFNRIGFMPQTFVDARIAFPVWLAKYEESLELHEGDAQFYAQDPEDSHRRAVSEADVAVSETVGSGSDIHLGMLYNSNQGELTKTFTLFGTFWNAQLNVMYAQTRGGREMISGKALMATFAVPLTMSMIAAAIILDWPDDDEVNGPAAWATWAAKTYTVQMSAMIPILKDLVTAILEGYTPKNVMLGAIEDIADVVKLINTALFDDEKEVRPLRITQKAAEATAAVAPIPLSGTGIRVIEYTDSYLQGDEGEVWNPYKALVVGKERNK